MKNEFMENGTNENCVNMGLVQLRKKTEQKECEK